MIWAEQAITALLDLKAVADRARAAGHDTIDPEVLVKHEKLFTDAAEAGTVLNAERRGKLEKKRCALATRMLTRKDDYLRFARDLRVPFDNYPDGVVMPMITVCGGPAAGQGGALAA